jgi:hypothetical protein
MLKTPLRNSASSIREFKPTPTGDENRSPDQIEWDHLEKIIRQDQAIVRDTSRDVPTN